MILLIGIFEFCICRRAVLRSCCHSFITAVSSDAFHGANVAISVLVILKHLYCPPVVECSNALSVTCLIFKTEPCNFIFVHEDI